MIYTVECRLSIMGEIQVINTSLSKRVMVVTTMGEKPQKLAFDIFANSFGLLDGYRKDQAVLLSFRIQGREYTNRDGVVKYFNNLIITGISPFK